MADCELSCAKYWVFLFNLVLALTGLIILIAGVSAQYTFNHHENFVGNTIYSVPIIMIIVGVIIFVVAFFGCCGAIQENSCLMLSFTLCLLVIILLEVGIGAAGFAKQNELEGILDNGFNNTLTHYSENVPAWAMIQDEFKCCGIKGPDDWSKVFGNETLPMTCCKTLPVNGTCIRTGNVFEDGCKAKLFDFLKSKTDTIGAIGIAVALIQIIGLAYACYLQRAFRRNYETY